MTLAGVLAAAIVVTFVFALLSVIASAINEGIAAFLGWRATSLWDAIAALLEGGKVRGSNLASLADRVYGHALVSGLASSGRPSYVPARKFTLALVDVLSAGSQAPQITAIQQAIATMPSGTVRQSLQVFATEATGDIDAFKKQVDDWFDDAMDRFSGIYKRWTQMVLAIIGFGLAVALNVNTITLASSLSQGVVAQAAADKVAEKFQQAGPTMSQGAAAALLQSLPVPIGWSDCAPKSLGEPGEDSGADHSVHPSRAARFLVCQGFSALPPTEGAVPWDIAVVILGWLLTAIAVSFGAPFWFDVAGQLINLRSGGPKPPKASAANNADSA